MVRKKTSAEGLAKLAQMVKNMPGMDAKKIMAGLGAADPEVGSMMKRLVFTFDDIKRLDDRSLALLARAVERRTMAMSLKGEPEEFRARIYRAMTDRGALLLRDEVDDLGRQPASKVGEAQKIVAATAEALGARGDIVLPEERF